MKKLLLFLLFFLLKTGYTQVTYIPPKRIGAVFNFTNNLSSIGWQRSGTNVTLFSNGDNVGIGTSTPVSELTIQAGLTSEPILTLKSAQSVSSGGSLIIDLDSTTPASGELLGQIIGRGKSDLSTVTDYANVRFISSNTTDADRSGQIDFDVMFNTVRKTFARFNGFNTAAGQGIIEMNPDQQDVDFRVETANDKNTFYVDALNNKVGIRTATPQTDLHLENVTATLPTLTLRSSQDANLGPNILMVLNSTTPATGDVLGTISGQGNDSAAALNTFAALKFISSDVTDTAESGELEITALMNGTARSLAKFNGFSGVAGQGEISFNEDAQDVDFRVESNTSANALFVEGSSGNVGLGINSLNGKLHVLDIDSGTLLRLENQVDTNEGAILQFYHNTASPATTDFLAEEEWYGKDNLGNFQLFGEVNVKSVNVTDASEAGEYLLYLYSGGSRRNYFSINGSTGAIVLNEDGLDTDVRIESLVDPNTFFVEGSSGNIGIGTGSPLYTLHLENGASQKPQIRLVNTNDNNLGSVLTFEKNPTVSFDGDEIGRNQFIHNGFEYARMSFSTDDVTLGDKAGLYNVQVAMNDILRSVITFEGNRDGVDQGGLIFNEDGQDVNLRVESASNSSALYVDGLSGFVSIGNTVPDTKLEIAGGTVGDAAITLNQDLATPASPTSNGALRMYVKGNKLVLQFNDGGTVRYKYLDLTGTTVTWVQTTTAP